MAENEDIRSATATGDPANASKQLVFQKVYLKDCSFESPNAPAVFTGQWEPKVTLNMTTTANDLGGEQWEVVLAVTIEARLEEKVAFLCEIQQAGAFLIKGFSEDERRRLQNGYCPSIIFPYAREAISDFVMKGGFPQLLLQPVNFDALYLQHLDEIKSAEAGKNAAEKH